MKIGIISSRLMRERGWRGWNVNNYLCGGKLEAEVEAAQKQLKKAQTRLDNAIKSQEDARARQQELVDKGELTIIAEE